MTDLQAIMSSAVRFTNNWVYRYQIYKQVNKYQIYKQLSHQISDLQAIKLTELFW